MNVPRSVNSNIMLESSEVVTGAMASGAYKWCVENGFILPGHQGGPSETFAVPVLEASGTMVVVIGLGRLVRGCSCFGCRGTQDARVLEVCVVLLGDNRSSVDFGIVHSFGE